jgi:hypothetical protein
MRALAIVCWLAAASPLAAQSSETRCRWVRNVWTCSGSSQPSQGELLQAGRDAVPSYQQSELVSGSARLANAQAEEIELRNQAERRRQRCSDRAQKLIEKGEIDKGTALFATC